MTPVTAQVTPSRFAGADRLRGLIMVLMAIDHASFFIARVHPAETWAAPPPHYSSTIAFLTRWPTHLCAPGFFLLMGAGMAWLAASRRTAGWSGARTSRFFVTRGLALLVIQHFIENPAWLLGVISASPSLPKLPPMPGSDADVVMVFAVITALGVSMIFWSWLIEAPGVVIAGLSLAALAASTSMTPLPSDVNVAFPLLTRFTFVPGATGPIEVVYSVVPWLVPTGFGLLLGRWFLRTRDASSSRLLLSGAALIGFAVVLRVVPAGDPFAPLPGTIGFLTLTKYPPSLVFFAMMLGIDLVLLWLLTRISVPRLTAPLEVFGRTPLFFYLAHLYLLGALSWFFRSGTTFFVMYLVWGAALVVLYPACRWYADFKTRHPVTSIWRLL